MRWRLALLALVPALLWSIGPATPSAAVADPVRTLELIRPSRAEPALDFELATPERGRLRLGDFRGKVVLLNFWATWCKPCEDEMPAMESLHQKFKGRGLAVVAVSLDAQGAAVVPPFVKRLRLTFPVGLDPKMTVGGQYGVWALPATFIIDRKGNRILVANGPRQWNGRASHDLFESLLK